MPPNEINETGDRDGIRQLENERKSTLEHEREWQWKKNRIKSYAKINDKYYTICIMTSFLEKETPFFWAHFFVFFIVAVVFAVVISHLLMLVIPIQSEAICSQTVNLIA